MSKIERKERERQMRRNDIVDAAERLFFSRGYENVTMDDIAKELEMARATLYLSFKNKEEIYAAIAIRASNIVRQMFSEINSDSRTGLDRIRLVATTYHEFYEKYTGYYMAYYHTGMFESKDSPELEELRKIRMGSFRVVVDAVRDGMKDGSIREDIDPVAATLVMLSMSNNALAVSPVTKMYMENFGLSQGELYRRTIDMMLRSIENVKQAADAERGTAGARKRKQ